MTPRNPFELALNIKCLSADGLNAGCLSASWSTERNFLVTVFVFSIVDVIEPLGFLVNTRDILGKNQRLLLGLTEKLLGTKHSQFLLL